MILMKKIGMLGMLFIFMLSSMSSTITFAAASHEAKNKIIDDFEEEHHQWEATSARANSVEVERTTEQARFGQHALKISYDFLGQQGTSGVYASIQNPKPLPGVPKKISMWVYGDAAGHWLRGQMKDATGQYFHLDYAAELDWKGWKYVEAEIPEGWKAPYTFDLPVRYMATSDDKKNKGAIYIDDLRIIYEDDTEEDVTNPVVEKVSPQGLIKESQPLIQAQVSDTQSKIDVKASQLLVDGQLVPLVLKGDQLQGQVVKKLADGLHRAELTVVESAGNATVKEWTFHVDTGSTSIALTEQSELLLSGQSYEALLRVQQTQAVERIQFNLQYNTQQATFVQPQQVAKGVTMKEQELGTIKVIIDGKQAMNELAIPLPFQIAQGAKGQFQLTVDQGEFVTQHQEVQPFYHEGLLVEIEQPLQVTASPFSVGNPTVFQVKDYKGKPVQGAKLKIKKAPHFLKVTKDTTIYKGGSGIQGDAFEQVKAGTYLYYTNAPTEAFPFYRVYMKNGEVRYYHLPAEAAEIQQLEDLLPETDNKGEIQTPYLSLASGLVFEVIAEKGEASSDTLSLKITKDYGTELPTAITRSFVGNLKEDVKLSWRTNVATTHQSLQIKEVKTNQIVEEVNSRHEFVSTLNGDFTMHHAVVKGLNPRQQYSYRVGHEQTGWSEEKKLVLTQTDDERVSFLFATDSQAADVTGFRYWTELMQMGLKKLPHAQFIMHGGDIVDNGNDMNEWDAFFKASTGVIDHLPFMATVGNHEVYGNGAAIYRSLFDYELNHPEQMAGDVYSYDLNGVRFITLNTESGEENMRKQAKWLEEQVKSAGDQWTVVTMHRAPYPSNPLGGGSELAASIFTPVIERTGVDLVLVGHDHSYMRTLPMKAGKPATDGKGTTYVIGGSAGPKFYPEVEKEYTAHLFGEDVQVVTAIEIEKNKLTGNVYTIDGEQVDSFELEKQQKSTIDVAFEDIEGNFAEHAIRALASEGIIKGKNATTFSPNTSLTRGEFAILLSKALQLPVEEATGLYQDVPATHPYVKAIEATHRAGLIKGYPHEQFKPEAPIVRQEMAAILVRAYEAKQIDETKASPRFKDDHLIHPSLKKEVYAAERLGLIVGYQNQFNPLQATKRSEAALMLYRFLH